MLSYITKVWYPERTKCTKIILIIIWFEGKTALRLKRLGTGCNERVYLPIGMGTNGLRTMTKLRDPQVSPTWAVAGTVVVPIFIGTANGTETTAVKMTTELQTP